MKNKYTSNESDDDLITDLITKPSHSSDEIHVAIGGFGRFDLIFSDSFSVLNSFEKD